MQDVYRDGSGGEIKGFNVEGLKKSLADLNVDHVEVFNTGSEAHKKAVGRINDLVISRREKRKLEKMLKEYKAAR